jgi:hypothetical protein
LEEKYLAKVGKTQQLVGSFDAGAKGLKHIRELIIRNRDAIPTSEPFSLLLLHTDVSGGR